MKRGQVWEEGTSSSVIQKSPRLESNNPSLQIAVGFNDVDFLSLIPEEPYKRVVGFLSLNDKKTLNLCSKACSKRIKTFDESIQNWHIKVLSKNQDEIVLTLMRAKIRNTSDATIDNIQLHLQFSDTKDINVADNLINQWKNNIVDLTIPISPNYMFLMDPNLKIPNLMSLKLTNVGRSYDYDYMFTEQGEENPIMIDKHRQDKLMIATDLVEKHFGSLKSLCIGSVPVLMKKPTKLEKFSTNCGDLNMFSSYLTMTSQTLVKLSWGWSLPAQLPAHFIHPELLKLKELTLTSIPIGLIGAILRSCRKTLQALTLSGHNRSCDAYGGNILGILDLPLSKLDVQDVPSDIVIELLHASRTTLQEFELCNEDSEWSQYEYENEELPNNLTFPKLTIFKCSSISELFSMSVVRSAKKTLKHFTFNSSNANSGKLHGGVKLPLTHFHAHDISYRFILQIVKAARLTLEELHIGVLENKFQLGDIKLNLKRLKCSRTNSDVVFSLISAASLSLEHLELKRILYDRNFSYSFEKLQLRSLKGHLNTNLFNPIISSAIVSSCDTLESISLIHQGSFHDQLRPEDLFEEQRVKFSINGLTQMQLKNFECMYIPARIVSSVIALSGHTLISLNLVKIKRPKDFTLVPNMILSLREFYASDLSPNIVADVITRSCSTLKVLKLDGIGLLEDSDDHLAQHYKNSLNLEELTILNSSSNVAMQFITELKFPLRKLNVKNITGKDKTDLLAEISSYKEANPFCHVDRRDEEPPYLYE